MIDGSLALDVAGRALLARVFPRYDFSSDPALEFLSTGGDVEVQAAPGSGKTTLLVAKLLLLADTWPHSQRGICVLSHTNAARSEVEKRLATHPAGASLLNYPHFVGTLTTFAHQFLAMPLVRGAGWSVDRIDSDLARALAFSSAYRQSNLGFLLRGQRTKRKAESWLAKLVLGDRGELGAWPPRDVPIVMNGPKAGAKSHPELREVKAAVVSQGVFSFADMLSLARRCVRQCPRLAAAVSQRFPLVFVDEAQDTSSSHVDLLETVFRGRSSLQRLGDVNQMIYDDDDDGTGSGSRWAPGTGAINLGQSRRLGPAAAGFASSLTVHAAQNIEPGHGNEAKPVLLLFDRASIANVIPRFAELVSLRCDGASSGRVAAMAVASRHRPNEGEQWPGSLVDYCPAYRAPGTRREGADVARKLYSALSAAREGEPLRDCLRAFCRASSEIAGNKRGPKTNPAGGLVASMNDRGLRQLFLEYALSGEFTRVDGWDRFADALAATVEAKPADKVSALSGFPGHETTSESDASSNIWTCPVKDGEVTIGMGSIHSVKGQTHDATLLLDTPLNRVYGVELALRCAFAGEPKPGRDQPLRLKAVTNVFVGATRARRLLCLAVEKKGGKRAKAVAAAATVWDVVDLTAEG